MEERFRIKWEPFLNAYIFGNKDGIEILKLSDLDSQYREKPEIEKVHHLLEKKLGFLNLDMSKITEEKIIKPSNEYQGAFSFPPTISIQTTQACIYRCAFCYDDHGIKAKYELSKEKIFSIIDEFEENGGMRIEWTGGEALTRKDLWEITEYAQSKGIAQNILTNFAIADLRDAMKQMKKYFYSVQVSCNAYGESYNEITRRKLWDRFVENLKRCRENDLPITLTTVIMEEYIDQLEDIAKLCIETDIKDWRLGWLTQNGRATITWDKYRRVIDKVYPVIMGLKEKYGHQVSIMSPLDKYDDSDFTYYYPKEVYLSPGGKEMLYIQSTGNTYPFPFLVYPEFYVGNIRDNSLKEMWDSDRLSPLRHVNYANSGCKGCDKFCGFWERTFLYSFTGNINVQPPEHKGCLFRNAAKTGNLLTGELV